MTNGILNVQTKGFAQTKIIYGKAFPYYTYHFNTIFLIMFWGLIFREILTAKKTIFSER
jgi:hypothetical protein